MIRSLKILALCLFLTGCNVPLKTVILQPSSVTSGYQTDYSQSWECSVPGSGLFLNGLGPEPSNPGEAPSGFDDIFNQGAQPFPCNEQEQILYRGHVQFDLTQFDEPASVTLNVTQTRSTLNTQPQNPPACIATMIGMSTGPRDDGQGSYFWDYDNDASMTPLQDCQSIIQPILSIGVSSQVRMWTEQKHFNYGFIIAGPNLGPAGIPSDNNGNVTFYGGMQLEVVYNPALNPRAPQ